MREGLSSALLCTPITDLPPCDQPALLISDLHVPAQGGPVFDLLAGVLLVARRLGARVFVLGDLFDSYVTARQVEVLVWRDVADLFAAAAADGVAIDLLPGNRDFLLGPEFAARSGVRLHPGGLRLAMHGVTTLMLHGDELCQNDLPYQRAKRWLRSGLVRAVARRLPVRVALWAAAKARRKSAAVIAHGDQTRFLPTRGAIAAAFASGAERLVFGHIHRLSAGEAAGGRYYILPAFDAVGVGFRVDADGIAAVRFGADGRDEPWGESLVGCAFPS